MSDWQQYVDQVIHKFDYDTNQWTDENVCDDAAIYGTDGSCWAFTPNFPELKEIEIDIDGTKIPVNEITCAIEAGKGNRNPSQAGIRFGGKKYMLTYFDPDTQVAQLVSGSGGAAVANCATCSIIGLFDKTKSSKNGGLQNVHTTVDQVSAMAAYLREQGY